MDFLVFSRCSSIDTFALLPAFAEDFRSAVRTRHDRALIGTVDRLKARENRAVSERHPQSFPCKRWAGVSSQESVTGDLHFGYTHNEIGFGWTNAVFVQLYEELSPRARGDVR